MVPNTRLEFKKIPEEEKGSAFKTLLKGRRDDSSTPTLILMDCNSSLPN